MLQVLEKPIDELKPWEANPRINDHAIDQVAKSIQTFGFNVPILCDQNMIIIAGHTRWKAAKKLGLQNVPTIAIEMTDEQRKAFSIADNKTAEIADWDMPKLRNLLEELRGEDLDLQNLGFSDADLRRIFLTEEVDEDEIPLIPGSAKTKPGDIYQLGKHRLICGDASDKEICHKLIAGNNLDIIITSPPRFNNKAMGHWENIGAHLSDIEKAVENCVRHLKPGGIVFWNVGSSSSTHNNLPGLHAQLFEKNGLEYLEAIAWVRSGPNFSIKRNAHILKNRFYYPAHQWEPILVYQKPGPMPQMTVEGSKYMATCQSDVWEIPAVTNPLRTHHHPAVGPVEIPFRALLAYSTTGASVFDPFAGSGTTLIAAEKTTQICFLIEINPIFCDVIIERWQKYTNQKAQLLSEQDKVENQ